MYAKTNKLSFYLSGIVLYTVVTKYKNNNANYYINFYALKSEEVGTRFKFYYNYQHPADEPE